LPLQVAGSRDYTYSQERGRKLPFLYLGYVWLGYMWLGYVDRQMYQKVTSILCGKIFELHKASVLSKVLVPCDNLPITVKKPPK